MSCIFVTGGARSGKSAFAQRRAQELSDELSCGVTFLATGEPFDGEMKSRIERHRAERPDSWSTVEEPLQAATWIARHETNDILLLDCLSLLLNNWMFKDGCTEPEFFEHCKELVDAIQSRAAPTIVVSNEVGLGLVPEGAASRQYRDWLGWLNQAVAAKSERAYLVVAGIPVELKR